MACNIALLHDKRYLKVDVDWEETIKKWSPSRGSKARLNKLELDAFINFCEYVSSEDFNGKTEFFSTSRQGVMNAKRILLQDGISRWEILEKAAEQIREHKAAWWVTQNKHPERISIELPFMKNGDNVLRYLKIQVIKMENIKDPTTVNIVWVDYHISKDCTEVEYVKK